MPDLEGARRLLTMARKGLNALGGISDKRVQYIDRIISRVELSAMITAIEIENFKGIRERVRIELKPITLLFGANSAGKSTIVQVLQYLCEIMVGSNCDPEAEVERSRLDVGSFRNLVHNHDPTLPIRIRAEFGLRHLPRAQGEEIHNELLTLACGDAREHEVFDAMLARCESAAVEIEISMVKGSGAAFAGGDRPTVSQVTTYVNGEQAGVFARKRDALAGDMVTLNLGHPILSGVRPPVPCDEDGRPMSMPERPLSLPFVDLRQNIEGGASSQLDITFPDASTMEFPDWDGLLSSNGWRPVWRVTQDYPYWDTITRLLAGPVVALKHEIRRLEHLGAIRDVPARTYASPKVETEIVWPGGLGAWDLMHSESAGDTVVEGANRWLCDRLRTGYRLTVERYKEVPLGEPSGEYPERRRVWLTSTRRSDVLLHPRDLGTGISQLIPVVVVSILAAKGLIAIEQPELHLHPALQAELGDLFIQCSVGERGNQFLLETHSEHLILRIMRRMRDTVRGRRGPEPPVRPEDVAVVFVESTPNGTSVRELRLKPDGSLLDPWPGGFFEESFDELFA